MLKHVSQKDAVKRGIAEAASVEHITDVDHCDGIEMRSRKLRRCRIELDASHADAAA